MTGFDADQFSQDFGFGCGSFPGAGDGNGVSGPYIPDARECLSCGFCLRACPTYKVRPEENHGPRGRVRLIERIVVKNDPLSGVERAALDACTLCRACETVCPSKMDYAGLYRQAMESLTDKPRQGLAVKVLLGFFARPRAAKRFLNVLIQLYQRSGLQWLFRRLPIEGGVKELDALLPVLCSPRRVAGHSRTDAAARHGELALFTGCVGSILDTETHDATITVLTRLGYDVRVPGNLSCCGALHAHNGEIGRAKDLARTNLEAFSKSGADAVVYNASGCGAFLSEYDTFLNDGSGVRQSAPPIVDVLTFLAEDGRIDGVPFRALGKKVAVHEPCSQRNVLKTHDGIYGVLSRIPDLDVVALPGNTMCCGAGGTKMLTQPDLAAPPRDEKVRALLDSGAEILLSTNLTCALHLARGVREAGGKVAVMHPVSLLARQLGE